MTAPLIAVDARYGLRAMRRGIGEYVYQLFWALAELPRPYRVALFGDGSADPEVVAAFRRRYPVEILSAPNFFWWEQVAFPQAARRWRAAFVHGTANIAPLGWAPRAVLTVHDVIEWHRGRDFPGQLAWRHRLSRLYRMNALAHLAPLCPLVFTVSEYAAATVAETLGVARAHLRVTPLAPKPVPSFPDPAPGARPPFVLVLGARDERKNLRGAFAALARTAPPVRFEVVGVEEAAVPWAQKLAETFGVAERVAVRGMVPDAELWALYRAARALLYPSYEEGFGLPVLEAMRFGCPVIASRRGAVPEVAGDAALLVDPADPEAMAGAIEAVWRDDDLWAELARRGQRRAARYTWANTAALTHAGYLALVEGGR
ncbi:MAG: glycosyltransferase family 4 protein [Firmicutes bacterium]|nr:glycosyltransferase family 4 protein [Alicyclobacillaceae bacterium]MCL6497094.1 glycosyltransferase family 4 protein [Bacillota bacterium]